MEMTITIDNVERQLSVTRDENGYLFALGESEYRVTDVKSAEGMLSFLIDRHSYIAHVSDGDGGVRLSIRGRNYRIVEEEMDVDRPGAGATGGDGRIEAPMPGTIVAVHAKEGDEVTAGTPIVVLESMKMQNEIAAAVDGVVKHVGCKPGDQVGFGALLVEIAAEGEA